MYYSTVPIIFLFKVKFATYILQINVLRFLDCTCLTRFIRSFLNQMESLSMHPHHVFLKVQ